MEEILYNAKANHENRTGHTVIVGLNFVECQECKRHAHCARDEVLVLHDREQYTVITAEEF